jgi:ketosteroid isomerase-like protein
LRKTVAVFVVVLGMLTTVGSALGKGSQAANDGIEAAVRKLDDKLRAAALKGDVAAIQELLADDYVSVSALTGTTGTKEDSINNYKSGRLKYETLDASEVEVHVYGPSTALVIGKIFAKGKLNDKEFSGSYRSSRLFLKRGGKWQIAALQSTKIEG